MYYMNCEHNEYAATAAVVDNGDNFFSPQKLFYLLVLGGWIPIMRLKLY